MPNPVNKAQEIAHDGSDVRYNTVRHRANINTFTGVGSGSATIVASPQGTAWIEGAGTPSTQTSGSAMALTAANILTGICVLKPTASVNLTFDSAAQIVAAVSTITAGPSVGDVIRCLVINGGTASTLAPQAASGVTFDTNQANTTMAANSSRYFLFRLTNVTVGSEAVTLYW